MPLDRRLVPLVRLGARRSAVELALPMAVRRQRSAALAAQGARLVIRREPDPAAVRHVLVPVEGGRILVRLYLPAGRGPFPLYVFLHGGGWCVGTLGERDDRCRAVVAGAGCVVASVDYRLAPENQFPTGLEDAYAALCWLVDHADEHGIDAGRVAVGGESAGANLAAVLCLLARDRSGPVLCHQWLDVPATDATCSQEGYRAVPDGYLLDRAAIDDFLDHYLPDPALTTDPRVSPLLAPDLRGLPPAFVTTAEYDKLRGDGEAYADALRAAGGQSVHVRLAGHIHPSFALTRLLPSARDHQARAIAALARSFQA